MPNYSNYIDFLKDRSFICWQLAPNKELEDYWLHFIEENPHCRKDLKQAINYLKTSGLNKKRLQESDYNQLLEKIQLTISENLKRRKKQRALRISIATLAASALLLIGFTLFLSQKKDSEIFHNRELIVGELLVNEDVKLITGKESLSFKNDVQVEFDKDGKAKITPKDNEETTVETDKNSLNRLIVPYGKRSTLILSDGSRVWLNSGSVLEFPSKFAGENREVSLTSGEMFIEVAPDEKRLFCVRTSSFNVRVHGTKFNVSNYSNSPQSVVLVEGRVSLQTDNDKETFLSPNEQAVYSGNGSFETQTVDVSQYICWKDGYLQLNKTPMTSVLSQIERHYNISFNYNQDVNLQKRTCTGKIYLSENLENVMTTIGLLSSTKYIREKNQLIIINNPI